MPGFPSSYISSAIGAGNAQFAQNNYAAQQMVMGQQQGAMAPPPPMMAAPPPPPPVPPAATMMGQMRSDRGGMAGETMAGQMGNFANNVGMPMLGGAASLAGVDPFSLTMRAGMAGFAGGGMAGGAAAAGAVAMPLYAGAKLAQTYGSAFSGGMQDQAALNSTLRNNFQQLGGSRGQGFNQQQMGSIGGVVQDELNNNIFTNSNELNSLISQGAQGGMFSGVRDVGEFSKKFKNMLDTLKSVQTELGGSLNEAMQFVQEAKQSGVFNRMDRQNFAGQIREVTQMTGMSREDAMTMASQGAQISRQAGGSGAQGAFGMMRTGRQLGTALSSGVINEGQLSEATGGLTGTDAIQAFSARMMQNTARFTRRPMGRFSMFAMADPDNMGQLDRGAMAQFMAGDTNVGDVSRRAHRNVNRMGRAQAVNREGELRGAMLEQGGMAGQIGMMRMMLGDRVMNQGDDVSQLVMQRRFGMSRQESGVMQDLMRNQGRIAMDESSARGSSARSARREEVRRDRSFSAVMDQIGHSIEQGLGVHEVRQAGRNFVTKLSAAGQKVMDRMLGIYTEEMSTSSQTSFDRIMSGQGTDSDRQRLSAVMASGGGEGDNSPIGRMNPFGQTMAQRMSGQQTLGARLEGMGYNISGRGAGRRGRAAREYLGTGGQKQQTGSMESRMMAAVAEVDAARMGVVAGGHEGALAAMEGNTAGTNRALIRAEIEARGGGNEGDMLSIFEERGGDRHAAMAYMARQGQRSAGMDGRMELSGVERSGGGSGFLGMRDPGRQVSATTRGGFAAAGAVVGTMLGGMGAGIGAAAGMGLADLMGDLGLAGTTSRERLVGFASRGGHMGSELRQAAETQSAGGRRILRQRGRGGNTYGNDMSATQRRDHMRGLARGLSSSEEAMDAVTQEEDTRRLILRMSNGGSDAQVALAELREMGLQAEPKSERRKALQSLSQNAGVSMRRDRERGGTGRVGSDIAGLALSPEAARDARAAVAQAQEMGRRFAGAATALDQMEGMGESAEAFRNISAQAGAGTEEGMLAAGGAMNAEIDRLSQLGDSERATAFRNLSEVGGREGQERVGHLVQAAAGRAQLRRSLGGRGRRGRRQAGETAQQLLGGLGMGRDFSVDMGDQGRVTGRRAQAMLRRVMAGGGTDAQRVATMQAINNQATESGLSTDATKSIMSAVTGVRNARTDEARSEATDTVLGLRDEYAEEFEQVESRRAEQALAAAGRQDPMGQERNRILTTIATNTGRPPNDPRPGPTGGIPGGNMSGGE